jgi:serine/threonine protein kinase
MSSGSLPLTTYHRAQSLGSGTYGSVVTVYDDDGQEFALKLFMEDDDDDKEEKEPDISLGALREISILRLLRGENAHPNIIQIHDVQTDFVDEEGGAGTNGYLGLAMPLFPEGALSDALSKIRTKRQKLGIAHGILSAIAYLHENSIIHRDIKGDNILLEDAGDGMYRPVLIDFSLAKIMDPKIIYGKNAQSLDAEETEATHTGSIGTPTYRAPEVVDRQPYGLPSDLWSVGVILLEVLQGKTLEANKDNGAIRLVSEGVEALPKDQPFPNLIRGLLQNDPEKRWTARHALDSEVFRKFGFTTHDKTFRILNVNEALPFDIEEDDEDSGENDAAGANTKNQKNNDKQGKKRADKTLLKRYQIIQKVCSSMKWNNPMTAQAALTYSIQMSQLDEVDDMKESQALLDCVVLAHKFFEKDVCYLQELEVGEGGPMFKNWTFEQYIDNEGTLLMMLDFCLYPREWMDIV